MTRTKGKTVAQLETEKAAFIEANGKTVEGALRGLEEFLGVAPRVVSEWAQAPEQGGAAATLESLHAHVLRFVVTRPEFRAYLEEQIRELGYSELSGRQIERKFGEFEKAIQEAQRREEIAAAEARLAEAKSVLAKIAG